MKQTKINRLRMHLTACGKITKMEAAKYYHIYGLAEQVRRLRDKGMNIESVMTPNGDKQAYATYTLRAI